MIEKFYVFDVDGVLCDRGKTITPDFKDFFLNWINDKKYYLVTGSPREKTIEQIGIEICEKADISFHCLGNSIWTDGNETVINNFILHNDEEGILNQILEKSEFPYRTGNHINKRNGSYNFSIVGRNADIQQRIEYINYDKLHMERYFIVKELNRRCPRLEAFIGGDISIDICLKQANKSSIIDFLQHGFIYYFGDALFEYGVDYPILQRLSYDLSHVSKVFNIVNSHNDTRKILEKL